MPSQHPEAKKLISQGIFDSIKSFKEFEGRVSKLFEINTKTLGDAFEIFVEAYLATQPIMQCAETYLVSQLPLDVRNELNLPNNSSGVDGVYKSNSGVLVPYQVKFRSNRPPLSLTEVATFLGLTERAKDRILITNCDAIATDVKNRDYLRSIRGQDFDLLEEADFKLIEAWLKEKPVKRELPKPRPYQEAALKDIKNTLATHDRATTVMACGTGKTLVALWAAEQAQVNTVLVLLPSLTLMQQTLLEWSKNNSWGNRFSFICVCSDPTVKANDEIEIDPTDIDFKVDTDPELVKEFLNQKNEKVKVVFSTYQSSKIVGEANKGLSPFDFAIFDEAHKTTGPKGGVFAYALDDQNINIKKRLFLTATPRHYDIRHRDKEGEFKVISMDDESIYGPRAHSLTFGSAASQGIICNYKVIISLIDKNQVDDFALKNGITLVENDKIGTRWVASQIALQQAIEKVNASKIITFHSRVKLAKEFSSETSHGIKRYLKDFKVMHVNGEQRSNERTDLIRQFKDFPKSLITNARCLTEGVDVPAVDMVAFIDARHSKVDIAQAIGRAMRIPRGSNKKFGYIVVPLFADTSDLNNLEETIKKEGFDDVAEILNALQEQDEELVDIIRELQEAKGRGEIFNPKRLSDKVETIGTFVNLLEITKNISLEITNSLGSPWDYWFGLFNNYVLTKQNVRVLQPYKNKQEAYLAYWVRYQRKNKVDGKLTADQICKLNALNFLWDAYEDIWYESYQHLVDFYKEFNHSRVEIKYVSPDGFNLGKWVNIQRKQGKDGSLPIERQKKLNLLNFIWDPMEDDWKIGYEYLIVFYNKFKTCNVLFAYVNDAGYGLGGWVHNQRRMFLKNKLSKDRIEKLNAINFSWDPYAEQWEEGYNELVTYIDTYGDAQVPNSYKTEKGFSLGSWVTSQRNNLYRNTELLKLTEETKAYRIAKLNKIDFIWDPFSKAWNEAYELLLKHHKEYGNCDVPDKFKTSNGYSLGAWAFKQRKIKNTLSKDQIDRLNLINFVWDKVSYDEIWESNYIEALNYFDKTKSLKLEHADKSGEAKKLYKWFTKQRVKYKSGKLSIEHIKKLESLPGWFWVNRKIPKI